ncbi:MAG: hypothetical protein IJ816_01595 [Alloprevotella sp.]|nr:hypothetical protein [Alloprevotella sp.]
MKHLPVIVLLCSLLMIGCAKSSLGSFVSYETEYLNTENDGSLTLRAWGQGKGLSDAREQAQKNAVNDIIFKGINTKDRVYKPLVLEVNARDKYENYFDTFFRDGGAYTQFASSADERESAKVRLKNTTQRNYGSVVRVLRSELRQKLIEDGIIKP